MEHIKNVVYQLRAVPDLIRRRAGFLIKEILEHSARKINSTLKPNRSIWMYSAHSSTITPILNSIGIYMV